MADLANGRGDSRQRGAYEELEWRRCAASFNYWRTNYAWLQVKSGAPIPWYEPFECQNELGDLWQAGESTTDIKTRQIGITSDGIHFCLWDCIFHDAVTWNYFGEDEDAGKDAISRLGVTLDRIPQWMLDRAHITPGQREDKNKRKQRGQAQRSVTILTFGLSKIRVLTGSVGKAQGRVGKVFWDDAAKHEDKERKWQLMLPSFNDPDPANRGQVIIVFNGQGEEFCYHQWQRADAGENSLTAHFWPWMADPRRTVGMHRNERGELTSPWLEQAWRDFQVESPDADWYAFKAGYPETVAEAVFLHGNSRFDLKCLNAMARKMSTEEPPQTGHLVWDEAATTTFEGHRNGKTRLYLPPEPGGRYLVSVDAAAGRQSGDYCVAMVGRVHEDGVIEQVCVYEAKVEPGDELVYNALALCHWYNGALLIPETGASGHGQDFCNEAKRSYDYIYQAVRTSRFSDEEKLELGFATARGTKNPLINTLGLAFGRRNEDDTAWDNEPRILVHDRRTLDELVSYEIDPETGKSGAPKGSNDDLVIALALLIKGAEWMATPSEENSRTFAPTEW